MPHRLVSDEAERWKQVARRIKKQHVLKQAGAKRLGSVYTVGPVAAAIYGAEVTGMPPSALTSIRRQRLVFDRKYIIGANVNEQWLLEPISSDPGLRPQMAPLMRYHREVWNAFLPFLAPQDNLNLKELVSAFQGAENLVQTKQIAQSGPIGQAIVAAKAVGWSFKDPFTILDASGDPMSMSEGSPEMLRQQYAVAHRAFWENLSTNALPINTGIATGSKTSQRKASALTLSAVPCGTRKANQQKHG